MAEVSIIATDLSRGAVRQVAIFGNVKSGVFGLNRGMPANVPTTNRRPAPLYLREWVEFRRLTGEQLAARIGTTKSVISKLANGRQRYNQDWLEIIAFHLDCDVPDLFRHPESPSCEDLLRRMGPQQRRLAMRAVEDISRWSEPSADGAGDGADESAAA